jgi:hypothetical protein
MDKLFPATLLALGGMTPLHLEKLRGLNIESNSLFRDNGLRCPYIYLSQSSAVRDLDFTLRLAHL